MAQDFQSGLCIFGLDGLNIQTSLDKLKPTELSRMLNLVRAEFGGLTGRPGNPPIAGATAGTGRRPGIPFLAIARLNNQLDVEGAIDFANAAPQSLTPSGQRFIQIGSSLFINGGSFGNVLTLIPGVVLDPDNPAIFIAYRPPLSGQPWLYIVGRSPTARAAHGMVKVLPTQTGVGSGPDGALVTPWGLPPATNPDIAGRLDEWDWDLDTVAISDADGIALLTIDLDFSPGSAGELFELAPPDRTPIDTCDTAGWTNQAGTGAAPSNATDNTDFKAGTGSLKLTTAIGGAGGGYWNAWAKANILNLSQLSGSSVPATDDDLIHIWAQMDRPDWVLEFRMYFILSNFDATTLPGASAGKNDNAYVKTFYPRAFAAFVEGVTGQLTAQTGTNIAGQTVQQGGGAGSTATVPDFALGRRAWTEFGIVGRPLKRGEFLRLGADQTLDWKDVKGVCLMALTNTNQIVNVWVDDIYLYGGAGPDSTFPGNQPYNYRYRHYDPRTGAKGNPSPTSPEDVWLDSARQGFVIHPEPYGDPAIRQQIFRQGGSQVLLWYYVGINATDGGAFTDKLADDEIQNAEILEEDNDQPVTTKDRAGNTVLNRAITFVWGPFDETFFGVGDPYRPGNVYWCKAGELDHWPSANTLEILGTAVKLIAGCAFGGQPFVFGQNGPMFALYPSIASSGSVRYVPTQCQRGPVSARALVAGRNGIFFVANDGIYVSQGGAEQSITDDKLWPLFHGQERNGFLPIDFDHAEVIELTIHQGDLWFLYRDTGGTNRILIYSLSFNYWRPYDFGAEPSCLYSEPTQQASLIIGTRSVGTLGDHSGTSDWIDGFESEGSEIEIPAAGRTGALDQDNPRKDKIYGDLWIDANPNDVPITITALVDYEEATLTSEQIVATAREEFLTHPYGDQGALGDSGARLSNNTSIEFAWSTLNAPPTIYEGGPSFIVQPESTERRVTDWSDEGRLSDKMIKGIVLEVDTGGVNKSFEIQGDGTTQASIFVQAAGRQSLEFTWEQFRARLVRLKPGLGASPQPKVRMILYSYRWIFDEEPLAVARWETQEIDNGIKEWAMLFWSFVTIASFADVTLTVLCYNQEGGVFNTLINVIPSTGGAKRKLFVPFDANKSVLRKYTLTSGLAFYLYKEETYVELQSCAGGDIQTAQIFGNDDQDGIRAMHDSGLGAARSGGGS